MDLITVKEIMGHEDLRTTELYSHLSEQDTETKYRTKSPMDNMLK